MPAGVRRCNDFLGEQLASESERLHPVAVVDYADVNVAVEELERARCTRFRPATFFLSTELGAFRRRRLARPSASGPALDRSDADSACSR